MEFIILAVVVILLIILIKHLPKIFTFVFLLPSLFLGKIFSKIFGFIYCQLFLSIGFIFIPFLLNYLFSITYNDLIVICKIPFIIFQIILAINIIVHLVSLIKSKILCEVKYFKPNINVFYKYLYASVFLFLISNIFIFLLYVFLEKSNVMFFILFSLCCIFAISSAGMFIYSLIKKIKYLGILDTPLKEIRFNKYIEADELSFEPEHLDEIDFNDFDQSDKDDLNLLLTIGVIKKLITAKKIVNISLNDILYLYEYNFYNDNYTELDKILSEAEQLTKDELYDHIKEIFDFDDADAEDFAQNYLDLDKYNIIKEEEAEEQEMKTKEKSKGFFGGLVNLVKKGVDAYTGSQNKEKERMKDWPDNRLIQTAQKKQLLPAGMAAMQILKERYGWTPSDIAKK